MLSLSMTAGTGSRLEGSLQVALDHQIHRTQHPHDGPDALLGEKGLGPGTHASAYDLVDPELGQVSGKKTGFMAGALHHRTPLDLPAVYIEENILGTPAKVLRHLLTIGCHGYSQVSHPSRINSFWTPSHFGHLSRDQSRTRRFVR